jgi:hypothetical protein
MAGKIHKVRYNNKVEFLPGIDIAVLRQSGVKVTILKDKTMKPKKRKRISKDQIKSQMYKPNGDCFFEKMDSWSYKVHLTSSDASKQTSLFSKFEVEDAGKGHYGKAYIIRHKL